MTTSDTTNQPLLPASAVEQLRQETTVQQQLEALLIAAQTPLSAAELAQVLQLPQTLVSAALSELQAEYAGKNGGTPRGFELRQIAGGYRFYVCERFDPLVYTMVQQQQTQKLSVPALETLAVIAYKQPISRGQIAAIRAVNVDSVVRTLLARNLITEVGQDAETGAVLYGTTPELLEHLGLNSIEQLPPIAPLLDDGSEGFPDDTA